jgi:CotH kinase protein/Chitobiase/beta-hexosaminidase C-terminal domain/Lamin Tail Domain
MTINKLFALLFITFCLHFTTNAQVVINEYSAANWKQFADNYLGYEDWIELYNTTNAPFIIGGSYLSDNPNNLQKWKIKVGTSIPANGFLRIWCSGRDTVVGIHLHSNFKLTQTKSTPEKLTLSASTGQIMDAVDVEKTQTHQSRARMSDGATEWRICTLPTPKASNATSQSKMYLDFTDRPIIDKPAGFYADSVMIAISTDEPSGVIHYTLDGKEPLETSPIYDAPINIYATTVVKARVFSPDSTLLPGLIQFNTYFINVQHTMVVVSIAADEVLNLANGDNTLRPIGSIEYFGKDLERKTRSYGELNSHGQDSWANDQRSLDWVSRDEFGYSAALKEKIFAYSERNEYQRVILRASGDDNYPAAHHSENEGSAHMRDDYVQTLAKLGGLSLDVRASERCIVYLNGQYWGVYSFRELPDDHDYTDFYYNQGKYDLQYVLTWGQTWSEYGGSQAQLDWNLLRTYVMTKNMADSANYKYVTDRLDVQSLVDYFIVNTNSVCSDWLNYNTGWWRGKNPEGTHKKWGYILWDNDATFGFYINYTGVPDTSPTALPCDIDEFNSQWGSADPEKHIKLLNKLRTNPTFEQFYISRQADLMNSVYSCDNMLHVLDSMVAVIEPEMTQHAARWFGTYDEWKQNVARLRHFVYQRCNLVAAGIEECYGLTGPFQIVFKVEPPIAAQLKVNTLPAIDGIYQGNYFAGMDQKLEVLPNPSTGLVFDKWESQTGSFSSDSSLMKVNYTLISADTVTAHFRLVSAINEVKNAISAEIYPSVFSEKTTLYYNINESEVVQVHIVSSLGKEVAVHNLGKKNGQNSLVFDFKSNNLPSGIYFIQLRIGNEMKNMKVIYQH